MGLLLAKLAEYIVPDASQAAAQKAAAADSSEPVSETEPHILVKVEPGEHDENGQASVFVYKRDHESAAEILQQLISQDPRQFRSACVCVCVHWL